MTPDTIAHYRITGKLGEGGMGAVYRAIDGKLNREVAIKVLPDVFASDPDRLARFTREAQVLAALNHPNIAAIYGVEERALVMELVEGEDLKGPLPVETALKYAHQITEALDAAHEKGIVHRDLKPANIKVTPEGVVKILDFGLAKIAESAIPGSPSAADSPTLTFRATQMGTIMGTAAYMAPEQARGHAVDKRADIWAFGAVLFEMLTGTPLFEGESVGDTLAGVLKGELDWKRLPAETPPELRRLLERCLERDRRKRLRDLGDAWTEPATPVPPPAARRAPYGWIAAGVLAVGLMASLWSLWRAPKPMAERPMIQLDLDAGPDEVLDPTISLDGTRVVFVSQATNGSHLATRLLDQATIASIPGTEGARFPFLSPDGRLVGFFAGGQLKKTSLDGGAPVVLANAGVPGGGAWGPGGSIAAVLNQYSDGIVYRIPAMGGTAQPLTKAADHTNHLRPQFLPRGKGSIFTTLEWSPALTFSLWLARPGGTESNLLLKDANGARYIDSGYLVFQRQGKLFAAPFDLERQQVTGDAVPMVDDVAEREEIPQFDLSSNASLVYRRGAAAVRTLVRIDSSGKEERVLAATGSYAVPVISPDGKQVAFMEETAGKAHILIYDFARGGVTRLSLEDRVQRLPAWTADSQQVVYLSLDGVYSARADGGSPPERLSTDSSLYVSAFSRDGKLAAGTRVVSSGDRDLWTAPVERSGAGFQLGKQTIVASGPGNQLFPAFSPDGRWLAYMSNDQTNGRYQVYAISLTPDGRSAGGKWLISADAGHDPIWPAAGGQIFYKDLTNHIEVVSYTVKGDSFAAGAPRLWTPRQLASYPAPLFDVTADGKVIAVVDADSGVPETHIRVILNFGDEVRRRLAGEAK